MAGGVFHGLQVSSLAFSPTASALSQALIAREVVLLIIKPTHCSQIEFCNAPLNFTVTSAMQQPLEINVC